jgi:hypothetical protein
MWHRKHGLSTVPVHWDRSKPCLEGEARTDEATSLYSTWATKYSTSTNNADTRLAVTSNEREDVKDSGDVLKKVRMAWQIRHR